MVFNATAQVDKSAGGIAIPQGNTGTAEQPAATGESPFSLEPEKKPSFNYPKLEVGKEKSNFSMIQEQQFVSRGTEFIDRTKIKSGGDDSEPFKGNQYFGEYKTKSLYVQVMARDFGLEDGDRIKVLVNDRIVVSEVMLTNDFKGLQITLDPGFNKIDFEALNQGTSGPNTAEFRVYDDNQKLVSSNQWNLATGFKATVMIIKE